MAPEPAWDVLVIGGGPAGTACAASLAQRGRRVGLVEADDYATFRIGETLKAAVRRPLAELGLDASGMPGVQPSRGVLSVWGRDRAPRHTPSLLDPYGDALRVDRRRFDRALFAHAQACGVRGHLQTRVVRSERARGLWRITLETQRQTRVVRARTIVDAAGRRGAPRVAPRTAWHTLDRLVGFARRAAPRRDSRREDLTLVESCSQGWWYSTWLPAGQLLQVFMTDADLAPASCGVRAACLDRALEEAPETHAWWQAAGGTAVGPARGFDARSRMRTTFARDGWIAAGDAAVSHDPLLGQGVLRALESGLETASVLGQGPEDAEGALLAMAQLRADRFRHYVAEWQQVYGEERSWPDAPFWQRRRPAAAAERLANATGVDRADQALQKG